MHVPFLCHRESSRPTKRCTIHLGIFVATLRNTSRNQGVRKNSWSKRLYLNMRSLVGKLCEREGVKQVLTPSWVVLVTVWFA